MLTLGMVAKEGNPSIACRTNPDQLLLELEEVRYRHAGLKTFYHRYRTLVELLVSF